MANKSITYNRFGILNHLGEPWTPETFDTADQAQAYLDECRAGWPKPKAGEPDPLRHHRVSKVRVTVARVLSRKHKPKI